jgi:hypothetical protein
MAGPPWAPIRSEQRGCPEQAMVKNAVAADAQEGMRAFLEKRAKCKS